MAGPHKLDSWKEISAYLGRDERTVQRWAKERGLPVHRVPGGKRGGVFAYADEIEAWLNGQPPATLENGVAHAPASPAPALDAVRVQPLPEAPSIESSPGVHPAAANSAPATTLSPTPPATPAILLPHPPRRTSRLALSLAAVAVLALSTSAYLILASSRPVPARIGYSGRTLTAFSAAGQPLWTHELPGTFIALDPDMLPETQQTRIRDFDGDGEVEILSAASWLSSSNPNSYLDSALFRFSNDGKLLQRFAPRDVLPFAGRPYGPPWTIRAVLFEHDPSSEPATWLAFSHHTWWPAFLVRLDAQGRATTRFTHAGWIKVLAKLPAAGGPYLLAGGINNQRRAAMLAVLPENGAHASGPPDASGLFRCDQCSAHPPHRYYLFPPSEIARAEGLPYNQVIRISAKQDGFHVFTEESVERKNLVYEFTADFRFLGVAHSDYYFSLHDRYFKEGKLDHPASGCPESRNPPLPLEWRDGAWHKLQPVKR